MFYVGNKKVKEVVVKGSDNFLHRVRAGVLNSRYFYLTNPQNSELVDVVVNYSGERTRTSPQMVKKSELSSTTIRLNDISSQYELEVSASSPGYDCVDSFSSTSKTLKLKSDTTKSTVTLNLVQLSNKISTDSLALVIGYDPFVNNYSRGSFALENAFVYARDSNGQYQQVPVTEIQIDPESVEFFPMLSPSHTSITDEDTHFGFLSKTKAESLGFSATENPNGTTKECSDYYGWGCWSDGGWLWSDRELQEIFSETDDIRVSDTWQDLLSISGNFFHWGIYDLDLTNIADTESIHAEETFDKAWIVLLDSNGATTIEDVGGMPWDTLYSNIFKNQEYEQAQLIVPYSQPCGETYKKLQYFSVIQLQQDVVGSYFGTAGGISLDVKLSGDYQFSLDQSLNQYPYVYAGDFSNYVSPTYYDHGGVLSGALTYSVNNGFLYLGAFYPEANSIDITTDTTVTVDTTILRAVSLGYKLIPFITIDGSTDINGTISLY